VQGGNISLDKEEVQNLNQINDQFAQIFGIDIALNEIIENLLIRRASILPFYKCLLNQVDPEVVIVVVSYGKEIFIEACNNANISVVELQHGVIDKDHLAYSYPKGQTKSTFPDYIFTWGDFWSENVNFPIANERVISVGYPYLEQQYKKYDNSESTNQILFISQGTIGEKLSKFAVEVEQHLNIDYDLIYKLHPGEYEQWENKYPWLLDTNIEVIDSSEPPLYKLFAESDVQIGVGSSAIYEGLCFNLETYVYDCIGSSTLNQLVTKGSAKKISSVGELLSSLGSNNIKFDQRYYFEPNAIENACCALQDVLDDSS
jgi:hypothetical protein